MKLYDITYKLRKGAKKHHKYVRATTAKAAENKIRHKYGRSYVILRVKLA